MRSPPGAPRGKSKAKPLQGDEYLVRRKGSDEWHIDFTIGGRRFRRSCGTAEKALAAQLAHQEYETQYRQIVLGERPPQHLSLNDAFVKFYEEVAKLSRYGQQAQRHQMNTMLELMGGHTRLADLSDVLVNQMVQALLARPIIPWNAPADAPSRSAGRTCTPATVNRYLTTLSAICRRARTKWGVVVGEWHLSGDEGHKLPEPAGREVFLEQGQARAFMAAIIPHARPVVMLALATGLRKANVHDLTWERVSQDFGRIVLLQKGGKPLSIMLPPPIMAMLLALQPEPARRTGPVFTFGNPAVGCTCAACISPAKRGQAIASTRRAFATAARAIGVPNLRFHDLRHSFASWVLAAGGDMKLLQGALGHADIQTTARYSHIVSGRSEQVIGAATAGLLGPAVIEGKKTA